MESVAQLVYPVLDQAVALIEKFSFLGVDSHIVKSAYLDGLIQPVCDTLGMDLVIIKYTLGIFLVYPFAALLPSVPTVTGKHLYSMIMGVALMQWIYGPDWIHSFISSFVTYLICIILPKKYIAKIAFFWVMGYMVAAHGYRMYVSYMSGIFDFTGTQMVLTMKLTSFAYNLFDGTADRDKLYKDYGQDKKGKIYADRKRFAIEKVPNLLEFFGYIYCFPCILAGPAFEFQDYYRAINGTIFANAKNEKPPSPIAHALLQMLKGIFFLVAHLVISGAFPIKTLGDAEFASSLGHIERFLRMLPTMYGERVKFYFAWKMAEGGCVIAGFGFEGYDREGKVIGWRGVENIDILGFETAPNTQLQSRSWNKRTQGWLERYTYNRTGQSLVMTYFVSALWHGLYPGFFFFFMTIPFLTAIERNMQSKINPLIVPTYDRRRIETYPKTIAAKLYWGLCCVCASLTLLYIGQPFHLGSAARCFVAWGSYNYVPNILIVVLAMLLEILPGPKKNKKKD